VILPRYTITIKPSYSINPLLWLTGLILPFQESNRMF